MREIIESNVLLDRMNKVIHTLVLTYEEHKTGKLLLGTFQQYIYMSICIVE